MSHVGINTAHRYNTIKCCKSLVPVSMYEQYYKETKGLWDPWTLQGWTLNQDNLQKNVKKIILASIDLTGICNTKKNINL